MVSQPAAQRADQHHYRQLRLICSQRPNLNTFQPPWTILLILEHGLTYRYSLGGSALHVGPVDEINSGGLYELFLADLVSPSGVCLQTRTVDSEENVEDLYLSI